jgi:DNA-directed RNA polymerase II subunit RPB11
VDTISCQIVCRVEYVPDTKVANAATFEIQREDHTVGDPLVMQLHEDPTVAFAAYKIPHPLEHRLLIRVKTSSSASTPIGVYNNAIDSLSKEILSIKEQFRDSVSEVCANVDFEPHETYAHAPAAFGNVPAHGEYEEDDFGTRYTYGEATLNRDLAFDGAA